jgi:hypothetical protein
MTRCCGHPPINTASRRLCRAGRIASQGGCPLLLAGEKDHEKTPVLQERLALSSLGLQGIEWVILGDHSGGTACGY